MLKCRQKGFSLIEAAIVLGLIGLVIGGIWVAAASARAGTQASQFQQQTLNLVKNVRDYYAAQALPAAATVTGTLAGKGIFPSDMCPANCVSAAAAATPYTVRNAYGGSTAVVIPNVTTYPNQFTVTYQSIDEKGCVELAMRLSARSAEVGLVSYFVSSNASASMRTTFPVPFATIQGDCAATGNTIDMNFKIRN